MADEWLQQSVDVDVRSLLNDFSTSLSTGVTPLMAVEPVFGREYLKEGAYLRESHRLQVEAAQKMLGDVLRGLTALATAAETIAVSYITGDALTQATVDDVWDAFTASLPATTGTEAEPAAAGEEETPAEDLPLPEEAYAQDGGDTKLQDGSGRYIAEGTPGEYWISHDDEGLYGDDVPDVEAPRS
jgi:hypothetical protein